MNKVVILKDKKGLDELISYCKQTGYCSFDFETTGLQFANPNEIPLILGVSFQPGSGYIIPLGHKESAFKDNYREILQYFSKSVLEDTKIVKIAWNMKFEDKWLQMYGCIMRGRLFDGMLAKYLLDETQPMGLKENVQKFIPEFANYELLVKGRKWADIPLDELSTYCSLDCDLTLRLTLWFEKKLIATGLYPLYRNLIMMAHRVLAESEFGGLKVNRTYLENIIEEYGKKISDLYKELLSHKKIKKFELGRIEEHKQKLLDAIYEELEALKDSGVKSTDVKFKIREEKISRYSQNIFKTKKEQISPFNPNSQKQLVQFLFTSERGLKLPIIAYTINPKTKKPTDNPSTNEETLLKLKEKDKSGFIDNMLRHRELAKLYSTYMVGMQKCLSPNDRVHSSFLIHGTVTGRLSSREPNLQNIPRDTTASVIKKMFIPPKGYLLLEVDYSQAELRVVAEISKDKAMIDIFKRDYNIHVATACKVNGCLEDYDLIKKILKDPNHREWLFWEKQKKRAKLLNFGILYGQTEKKLSKELECTEEEAKKFIFEWYDAYPGVKRWIKKQKLLVEEQQFVQNLFGRKRRLPDIQSPNFGVYLEAQRQSVNAPIQGCASDFALFSSVIIREQKFKNILPPDMQQVYTVHDSLGFYIQPKDIHSTVPKIIEICNNPKTQEYFGFEMKHVRMKVSPEIGKSWGELTDYNPAENYENYLNN